MYHPLVTNFRAIKPGHKHGSFVPLHSFRAASKKKFNSKTTTTGKRPQFTISAKWEKFVAFRSNMMHLKAKFYNIFLQASAVCKHIIGNNQVTAISKLAKDNTGQYNNEFATN